ncbi:glutamyl-tRNA synthetase [Clostridium putrefaciens]|uniref:Glutamate--tRNA ligase n=1 Tax=Clostridium putrefaciens TaxID=99675 RepID=A0A381J7Y4_9CLOT|nr:glutamate--tRNA ligase [Clostridium putrefaciens]SUY47331.1 glutamyl-tRNA synthetase [Clostridium putrefaciens]
MSNEELGEFLFPKIEKTPKYYLENYPKREIKKQSKVVRYAPSPTGFQHIGGVFAALINERIASQSEGVFILRIEDTDQKREVEGAIYDTIETMKHFGMDFNEGVTGEGEEIGGYGPYKQSLRKEIYQTFAKDLVKKGLAYPCFCTQEELNEVREKQTSIKVTPGYYGEYAKCRNLSLDDIKSHIEKGHNFILRLKSPGDIENRVEFHDLIKGDISFPENNQDIVIIKSDGLPTYHFAHAIDDYLMKTTHVIRGEEWLSSLPIHVQLFQVLGFDAPNFAHIPTIMKQDGDAKRKLSKRKDPESAVSYYKEQGYPVESVTEYLLNIINSNFEQWREENPDISYKEFPVSLEKMSKSGALFDIIKLNDVSKNIIAKMNSDKVYDLYIEWTKEFDKESYDLAVKYEEKLRKVFNIDKEGTKPRKDFEKWSDVKEKIFYFFDELFYLKGIEDVELPKNMNLDEAKNIVEEYIKIFDINGDNNIWFENLKSFALKLGYAGDRKTFKKDPENYKGMVSDVAGVIRSSITHRTNTPDLYTIIQIMGKEKVEERFKRFLNL